jgi:hypothetical protein
MVDLLRSYTYLSSVGKALANIKQQAWHSGFIKETVKCDYVTYNTKRFALKVFASLTTISLSTPVSLYASELMLTTVCVARKFWLCAAFKTRLVAYEKFSHS